ncbi:hypothetical protein IDJ77_06765 [Mucilaginibacter sp. ZT4R22]|uniref:Uncharacterized protein n=1 Tax=Mucilaginibacter pankratovii TaxID=2772110 RepID=A0ABR7WMI5_9SPHI|nr:hypothetical protein [Mucilaginibacter pankratovii]MBD1363505.1 hypothetical protein [Mucilaginibacter pankratovii]
MVTLKNPLLLRYWFEFESDEIPSPIPIGWGVGLTAYSYDNAIHLLAITIFLNESMPEIKRCIENIDISTLEKNHVLPNVGASNFRGLWFPITPHL